MKITATLLLSFALFGCSDNTPATGAQFCTTQECALSPCTPDCAFRQAGACTGVLVAQSAVINCPRFCGLQAVNPQGCRRWRVEDPFCPYSDALCQFGDPTTCIDQRPAGVDYSNGGAICDDTHDCFGGTSNDMAMPCTPPADMAMTQTPADMTTTSNGGG